jgi:hypothetical protein
MEGILPSLYQGQYVVNFCFYTIVNSKKSFQQYVRCTEVDHESRVIETFYDVPLQIRTNRNSKTIF